jgi:hypothetical protein
LPRGCQSMNCRGFNILLITAALLIPTTIVASEAVLDEFLGLTLKTSDCLLSDPQIVAEIPCVDHPTLMNDPADDVSNIDPVLQNLRGTRGHERLKTGGLPPVIYGRLFAMNRQEPGVKAIESPERVGEIDTIEDHVPIPSDTPAIKVKPNRRVGRKSNIDRLLGKVLTGLKPVPSLPATRPEPGLWGSRRAIIALDVTVILGGLFALYLISRKTPPGTVLILASVLYGSTWAMGNIGGREMSFFTGTLRLLGFVGVILGFIDLLRKRKPRNQVSL